MLGVEKRVTSTLLETSSVEKIVEIDRHIGCAISGLQADSRTLIEHARYGPSKDADKPDRMNRSLMWLQSDEPKP